MVKRGGELGQALATYEDHENRDTSHECSFAAVHQRQ